MSGVRLRATAARAVLGMGVGLAILWFVLQRAGWHEVIAAIVAADPAWIVAGIAFYAVAMIGRILRWRLLLRQAGATVPFAAVAPVLIVGYAANFLLPARLGEFVRAASARRRFGLPASTVLGTIVVERLLDGMTVVVLLILALGLLTQSTGARPAPGGDFDAVALVAGAGLVTMTAVAVFGVAICRYAGRLSWLPASIGRLVAALAEGLASFRGRTRLIVIGLTIPIWFLEAASLGMLLFALGASPPALAVLILICVASLSTLLPTAPGYLGSYQLAFTLSLGLFGLPVTLGVAAASLAQIYLFGGTALVAAIVGVVSAGPFAADRGSTGFAEAGTDQ